MGAGCSSSGGRSGRAGHKGGSSEDDYSCQSEKNKRKVESFLMEAFQQRCKMEGVRAVLSSAPGAAAFHSFLRSEFCEENYLFIVAVDELLRAEPEQQMNRLRAMVAQFLHPSSHHEVNLSAARKQQIESVLSASQSSNGDEGLVSVMERAKMDVVEMLARGPFPRFLGSRLYHEWRQAEILLLSDALSDKVEHGGIDDSNHDSFTNLQQLKARESSKSSLDASARSRRQPLSSTTSAHRVQPTTPHSGQAMTLSKSTREMLGFLTKSVRMRVLPTDEVFDELGNEDDADDDGDANIDQRAASMRRRSASLNSISEGRISGEFGSNYSIRRALTMEKIRINKSSMWLRSLMTAVENLPVVVTISSAQREKACFPLVYVNAAFERLTGYPKAEVLGKSCKALLCCPDVVEAEGDRVLDNALTHARPATVFITNRRKDGSLFRNLISIKPIFDQNQTFQFVISIQEDCSELEAVANALHISQSLLNSLPDTATLTTISDSRDNIGL